MKQILTNQQQKTFSPNHKEKQSLKGYKPLE